MASALDHISTVFSDSSFNEMVRVYADSIVARMPNQKIFLWESAVFHKKSYAVRTFRRAMKFETSIAASRFGPLPWPAFIFSSDVNL